ncbi:uncharacterized protein TA20730 [Theileria annulata]|uniref:MutS domain II, putative n=1 Tax=Theileria annulata TaxID=5874 RepID=Q4UH11_THEAN|nr:uncharacterized protein TA20730 [Theileria annulata]CAI73628.1 hypothetical protein TA20730 [Theileria annulata]|eukprot:XP_954305.1 hypothetical protein TA20730 [Theileria annulata]
MFTNSDKYNDLPSDEEEITLIKHVKTNTSNLNVKVLGVVVKTISSIVKQVGISLINFSENAIKVSEISDNEYFTNLESLILQINPSNCVLAIPKDSLDYKRINHVISVCNLKTTFKFITNKEIDTLDGI